MQVYVLSAVPPRSNRYLQKYGLLSGVEIIKHPEVLKVARPDAKQRKAFVKKVKEVIASDFPHSVMGPSVFFTTPDPNKITDKHFIKQWDLQTIRIDLSRLVEDYPDTVVWGAELLPYNYAWRKMSDEEFEDEIAELGFSSWEEYRDARSRPLTLDEVYDFTQADPVELWEHYPKSDIGKKYASNVPHAFIITPMGYIPYEYIEYVDAARGNPSPNVMYHGSPNLFSKFEPRPHYLTDGKPVVFATPMREIALASLQPWTDDDFEQGVVDEDPPYMIEMYPNAFEDVYSGKQGYLYTLAPDSFYSTDQLTRFEKVSDTAPKVLDVELVENVLEELYASDMQMIPYEHGSAFRSNDYQIQKENTMPHSNRKNPLTMGHQMGSKGMYMQFYEFMNNRGEHVGQGDYEVIPNAEMLSKWDHAPYGEDFDNLKRVVGQDYPIGVVVDILISRLHRGKGYGKQILEETIRHMIEEEGVQSVLLIVETEPEEPFDLVEWYTREGFEDLGFTTRYGYPLMILR